MNDHDTRRNILVVDDDPGILALMTRMLEDDYEVRTAEDGRTALLLACARRPDLVLLDVHFPGMDGIETLGELTRHDPQLRVVMLSGDLDLDTVRHALCGGAVSYITKPFVAEEVHQMVDDAMALPGRKAS